MGYKDSNQQSFYQDEESFEKLFKDLYAPLVGFAVRYVSSSHVAEEIVQEVFFKFWEKSKDIEIKTTVKSYLYGAVRNTCLNHIKHQNVRRKYDDFYEPETNALPINLIEFDELNEQVKRALDALPEKCREVFELSRFESKSYKEISSELDISIKTVENQMGKALKIMREQLGHLLPLWMILIIIKNLRL